MVRSKVVKRQKRTRQARPWSTDDTEVTNGDGQAADLIYLVETLSFHDLILSEPSYQAFVNKRPTGADQHCTALR